MFWIGLFAGILVGTVAGVMVVALCQMASRTQEQRGSSLQPPCQGYDFGSPLLLRKTEQFPEFLNATERSRCSGASTSSCS
jgi:hypothetical protein